MPRSPRLTGGKRGRPTGIHVDPAAVRQARLDAGLSLAQVAGDDVSRTTIQYIEKGKARPSPSTLQLIADRTGRPLSHFLVDGGATEEQQVARTEIQRLVATEQFDAAINKANHLLERAPAARVEADVRLAVSRAHIQLGDGQKAHPHLTRAREFYEEAADTAMVVETLVEEARALHQMGDGRVVDVTFQAFTLAQRLRPVPSTLMVGILIDLGSLHIDRHQWTAAQEYFELGLRYAKADGNLSKVARLYSLLAETNCMLGRFSRSLDHSRRAYRLAKDSGDPTEMFQAEHSQGQLLLRMGDLQGAGAHFRRALQLCGQHGVQKYRRGQTLCSLAEVHIKLGQLPEARSLLDECLASARDEAEPHDRSVAWRLLGRLHLRQGNQAQAGHAFMNAIAGFRALQQLELARECHVEYARALHQAGRLEESIFHLEAAVEITQPHLGPKLHGGAAQTLSD